MWLITPEGFWSAVQDRNDPDIVRVRCRVHDDALVLIRRLRELSGGKRFRIVKDDYADYMFRVRCPRSLFATFAMEQATEINYDNFKNEVTRRQGHERHSVYMGVWSELLTLQPSRFGIGFQDYLDRRYGFPPEDLDVPVGSDLDVREALDEDFRSALFGDPVFEKQVAAAKRGPVRAGRRDRRDARRVAKRKVRT